MSLLGGGSKSSIPSMSWDSVLDKRKSRPSKRGHDDTTDDDASDEVGAENVVDASDDRVASDVTADAGDVSATPSPPIGVVDTPDDAAAHTAAPSDAVPPDAPKPFSYEPESTIEFSATPLHLGSLAESEPESPAAASPPAAPPPTASSPVSPTPSSDAAPPPPTAAAPSAPATPSAPAPAVAAASSTEAAPATPAPVAAVSSESATPAPATSQASVAAPQASTNDVLTAETPHPAVADVAPAETPHPASAVPPAASVPVTPPSQPQALPVMSLPSVAAAPSPSPATSPMAAAPYSMLMDEIAGSPQYKKRKKKRSGGGLGVILLLLLLAGGVAAGIIYGKPYLFPDDWDASARDYAKNIEEIRGVAYTEPLLVVEEPTVDYRARVGNQLLGDWEDQEPMWRALGLSAGGHDRETFDELLIDHSRSLYSEADGQVYHDAALPAVDRDPHVFRAMAEAAIDQEFRITPTASSRSLLAEAMTDAHVLRQATAIQQSSDAPAAIREVNNASLAFLPPVLDYQLVAPVLFAELMPEWSDVGTNPLATLGPEGAGPLFDAVLELAPAPPLAPTETQIGSAEPMSPSFWFMMLATHLDPNQAWDLSHDLSAASLLEVSAGNDRCFYSSWVPASTTESAAMVAGLSTWVATAAPELQATVIAADGVTHLRTCDPGDAFTSNARFAVGRDLIAIQATELAAIVGIIDAGGAEADVTRAVSDVTRYRAADTVLALEPSATVLELSAAAVAAVELIVERPVATDAAAVPVEEAPPAADG